MKCDVLILAGLWNSGPDHWQTHWQGRYPKWTKAEHRDWTCPDRDEWVAELDAAIAACRGAPILVAHSLGCMLVALWAASGSPLKVAGAFLVAPSDVEAPSYPVPVNGFAPIPLAPLPAPVVSVGPVSHGQPLQVEVIRARVRSTGMQQHQRLPLAVHVPPRVLRRAQIDRAHACDMVPVTIRCRVSGRGCGTRGWAAVPARAPSGWTGRRRRSPR